MVIGRRGKFTMKAYGYVDDRRCRPAGFPRFPCELGKRGMLAFAHIPTGATANRGFDIDEVKGKIVAPAVALTAIGADIGTGGATP